jgi:hypothetical protein
MKELEKRPRIGFGVANLGVAILVAFCVFRALPTRWWVVDSGAAVLSSLLAASGVLLLAKSRHAERVTRIAAMVALAIGLATIAVLAATAAWLWGVYAPIGRGGAILFVLVLLLVVPYVVVLPAVELLWIGPRAGKKT